MSSLAWLGELFEFFFSVIPRVIIVRTTELGIKWKYGKKIVKLQPGVHVYWPLVTDVESIVSARTSQDLEEQRLITADGIPVRISATVVCKIFDVVLAIGQKNWDVDDTIDEIAAHEITLHVVSHTFDEIQLALSEGLSDVLDNINNSVEEFGVVCSHLVVSDFTKDIEYMNHTFDSLYDD